jgi:surface antigen
MQSHSNQRILQYLRQHRLVSIVGGPLVIVTILGAFLFSDAGTTLLGALAKSFCSSSDRVYVVVSGDTLGAIAMRYNTTWQRLSSYNRLANPNLIYVDQHVCIPGGSGSSLGAGGNRGPAPVRGTGNVFPYGQCTWWANQRYYQMHGMFVPWATNADAWQWTARAYDFHWHVSSRPSIGAIVDLQPWVQGAYSLGHVAVVEQILGNGDVIASNMNWAPNNWAVTNVRFHPGAGVTFITA